MPAVKTFTGKFIFVVAIAATLLTGYSHENQRAESAPLYTKILYTKKLKAPVQIKIQLLGDKEVKAGEIYEIEAIISSPEDFETLNWEWRAPRGVELLDRTSGESLSLAGDQEVRMRMRFRQNHGSNKRMRLVLKNPATGSIVGRGLFHTTRQREIASENAKLLERQQEYLEENTELLGKIRRPKHTH